MGDIARGVESFKEQVDQTKAKAAGVGVGVILGKDLLLALLIGGVVLTSLGAWQLLGKWMDPAAAALIPGLALLGLLIGGGIYVVKKALKKRA